MNVNTCPCCKNTYSQIELNSINLGKHKLYLCRNCFKEYEAIVKEAYIGGQKNPTKKFNEWNHSL